MTAAPEALPEFDAPPVVEVVLAVGFEPAYRLSNIDLMEAWCNLFKQRFPVATEQPHYAVPRETLEKIQIPQMELIASAEPPPSRLWLTTEDKGELIQLQHDWFARNWRKVGSGSKYPRYENHIRPAFERDLDTFATYMEKQGHNPRFRQCEITYINHITANELWNNHGEAFRLFRIINGSSYHTSPLESIAFRSSSLIHNSSKEPVGRLYVEIDSVYDSVGHPIVRFSLTARGASIDNNRDAVMEFLDLGRDRIVRSFVELTSEEIQQKWSRTR